MDNENTTQPSAYWMEARQKRAEASNLTAEADALEAQAKALEAAADSAPEAPTLTEVPVEETSVADDSSKKKR